MGITNKGLVVGRWVKEEGMSDGLYLPFRHSGAVVC